MIEEEAFYGDTNIDEVVLPEGIEEIGERAFAESGLRKINLPSTLSADSIADNAFEQGVDVTAQEGTGAYNWAVEHGFIEEYKTTLPETPANQFSYESNGDGTYTVTKYNGSGDTIVFPRQTPDGAPVTAISSTGFKFSYMTAIEIPGTIKEIPDMAFYGCSKIQTLIMHEGITSIGSNCFVALKITELDIPGSVKVVGTSAFYGCSNLTILILQNGVETIGEQAFHSCSSLSKVYLPSSLVNIADNAFDNGIEIEAEVGTYPYEWAVANGFITVPYIDPLADFDTQTIQNGNGEFVGYSITGYHGNDKDVIIPAGQNIVGIGRDAFIKIPRLQVW